jgi:hypothetical protein
MTSDLRASLEHCRAIDGWLGCYPDARNGDAYRVTLWNNHGAYRDFCLSRAAYLEAFALWQLLLKPQRKLYRRRKKAA